MNIFLFKKKEQIISFLRKIKGGDLCWEIYIKTKSEIAQNFCGKNNKNEKPIHQQPLFLHAHRSGNFVCICVFLPGFNDCWACCFVVGFSCGNGRLFAFVQ